MTAPTNEYGDISIMVPTKWEFWDHQIIPMKVMEIQVPRQEQYITDPWNSWVYGGSRIFGYTNFPRGRHMRTIKHDKDDLLRKLKENRDKHRAEYIKAFEGYKVEAAEVIKAKKKEILKQLKELAGKVSDSNVEKDKPVVLRLQVKQFELVPPQDHTEDYDTVIKMLESHTEDTIEIEQHEFERFVLDKWEWKDDFVRTATMYAGKAGK